MLLTFAYRIGLAVAFTMMASMHARAWGPEGHSVVAEVAQRRLPARVLTQVERILGGRASLASIASWADDYREVAPETAPWHFVDIPLAADDYVPARDCPAGACVVVAIERQRAILADERQLPAARRQALELLVHFVGDIHQPLHAVGDAKGGNEIHVTYFSTPLPNMRSRSNLHSVWDSGIIHHAVWDWGAEVDSAETAVAGIDVAGLVRKTPAEWALESHAIARDAMAGVQQNAKLEQDYQVRFAPVVARQLGIAGIRLAAVLEQALGR